MRAISSLSSTGLLQPRRLLAAVAGATMLLGLAVPAQAAPGQAPAAAAAAVAPATPASGSSGDASEPLAPASTTSAATVRADEAWERGITGSGIGVALLDTGVAPGADIGAASPPQVSLAPAGRADGDGHGTFMAGLIAGRGGPDGPTGLAPDAAVWSVKVADDDGTTSFEQVLAGLDLVRLHADELGIRVVVLALGGPVDEVVDPLETALEQLWADGFVVVVASGNDGELTSPGASPYLLTVGAMDDAATSAWEDDRVVDWSGVGLGRDGRAKPDLLAPGVSVVSSRAPGSAADRNTAGSRIDGRWFRGTGTSMAAASTAGAAALLLDEDPTLGPDEVKGRLVAASRAIGDQGAGVLDVIAALDSDAPAANGHLPALDAAEGPLGAETGDWVGRSWVGRSWVGRSWVDHEWVGRSWVGRSWVGRSWVDHEWMGRSWVR